jgi:hypothetical protein
MDRAVGRLAADRGTVEVRGNRLEQFAPGAQLRVGSEQAGGARGGEVHFPGNEEQIQRHAVTPDVRGAFGGGSCVVVSVDGRRRW